MVKENDNLRLYELLGARWFQKVVFKAEKIKFQLLKPFSKFIINSYEKKVNRKLKKLLNKEMDETKKKNKISYYQHEKLRLKKEFAYQKNRNYHLDFKDPMETLQYLKMNKN